MSDSNERRRDFRCPIHSCQKVYREIGQFKTHLQIKHPELGEYGIQICDSDGSIEYS